MFGLLDNTGGVDPALWALLERLAEITGFRKLELNEVVGDTIKEWQEHLDKKGM